MGKKSRIVTHILLDIISITVAYILAAVFNGYNLTNYVSKYYYLCLIGIAIAIISNSFLKLYNKLWEYADFMDILKIIASGLFEGIYCLVIALILEDVHLGFAVMATFLSLTFMGLTRLEAKLFMAITGNNKSIRDKLNPKRVIVIGAGRSGSELIREMKSTDKTNLIPVCVLDDDAKKIGTEINGVKVVGKVKDVSLFVEKYKAEEILIAIPSISTKELKEIIEICKDTGLKIKQLPGIYQLADGEVSVSKIKDVSVLDLLGREQVKVNIDEIMGYIEDQTVLVTGGGGSIGSELCRQIAAHNPRQLIIFDIYENNAYDIQQELVRKHPDLNLLVLIGSVRDGVKVENVFKKYSPDIVFHAAAHKHVPLMETSPNEAVKNNVKGTFNVADCAGRNGTKRFIMISTDKAVNPTNIMGATKRICEMIIQTMDKKYETEYVAVRFGNVLGSNGSVIPLFAKQIAEGGPVTVTHKDIIRYFMTIPEAVSLVLQAGAYAKGGEIFVLDMGEPVKIYDLAINMIKLSGLVPFKDIDIQIIGLRPGEKLYEERLMKEEGLQKTENKLISIGKPIEFDEEHLFEKIFELYKLARHETDEMKELVHQLVPTYKVDKRN